MATKPITLRLGDEVEAAIRARAKQDGIPVATLIKSILTHWTRDEKTKAGAK